MTITDMEWNDAGNTKKIHHWKPITKADGGGPLLIVEHSVIVKKMMEIAERHYFEGDEIDEDGEVCILY
jgi:hypothetical protein